MVGAFLAMDFRCPTAGARNSSDIVRARQDLAIAESQLRDYRERLVKILGIHETKHALVG
jgi:hypothetical protein